MSASLSYTQTLLGLSRDKTLFVRFVYGLPLLPRSLVHFVGTTQRYYSHNCRFSGLPCPGSVGFIQRCHKKAEPLVYHAPDSVGSTQRYHTKAEPLVYHGQIKTTKSETWRWEPRQLGLETRQIRNASPARIA